MQIQYKPHQIHHTAKLLQKYNPGPFPIDAQLIEKELLGSIKSFAKDCLTENRFKNTSVVSLETGGYGIKLNKFGEDKMDAEMYLVPDVLMFKINESQGLLFTDTLEV